jgi:hypothetical protein
VLRGENRSNKISGGDESKIRLRGGEKTMTGGLARLAQFPIINNII